MGTAFRLDERFLKDFKIAEKFEVIELKKGKQINSFAKGIYLLKYGLAELTYLCSGIKIVVNEGSIISESAL